MQVLFLSTSRRQFYYSKPLDIAFFFSVPPTLMDAFFLEDSGECVS